MASNIHNSGNPPRNNRSTDNLRANAQPAGISARRTGGSNDAPYNDDDRWSVSDDGRTEPPTPPDVSRSPSPEPQAQHLVPAPLAFTRRPQQRRAAVNVASRNPRAPLPRPERTFHPQTSWQQNRFPGEEAFEMNAYPTPVLPPPPPGLSVPTGEDEQRASWSSVPSHQTEVHSPANVRASEEGNIGSVEANRSDADSLDGSILSARAGVWQRHKGKLILGGIATVGVIIAAVIVGVKFGTHQGGVGGQPTGTSTTSTISATPTTSVSATSGSPTTIVTTAPTTSPTTIVTTAPTTSPTSAPTPTPTGSGQTAKYTVDAPLLLDADSTTGISGFSCASDVETFFKDAGTWTLTGPNSGGGYAYTGTDGASGTLGAPQNGIMTSSLGTQQGSVTLPPGTAPCDFTAAGLMTVDLASNSQSFFGTLLYTLSGSGQNCPIIMSESGVKCTFSFQGLQAS